ncbi:MAG: biotin--[acetyl-CoA-carboxylase] ligase [Alphaproteobacteria bacterium]|nr:biotin--[acetyl-CoA-carboxylase] ligase [Alphaproteobacteria bacterium]
MDLPDFYTLVQRGSVASTNDVAKDLAANGAREGTLVVADTQSAGRGRRGKPWTSPAGNLYMSVVMRPNCAPVTAVQLGFVAGVALWDAIADCDDPGIPLKLKWPNDVLLDGRKVSGILLESATKTDGLLDWVVLGIGVNLAYHPSDAQWPAADLSQTRDHPAPQDFLPIVATRLLDYYLCWDEEGFGPIRCLWLEESFFAPGDRVTVGGGEAALEGTFEDIDESGALILRLASGETRAISYGEIFPAG